MTLKSLLFCLGMVVATPALADFHYTPSTMPSAPSSMSAPMAPAAAPTPVEAMPLTSPTVSSMPRSSANAPSAAAMTPPPATAPMMQDTTESLNASEAGPMQLAPSAPAMKMNAAAETTEPMPLPRSSRLSGGAVVQGFGNQIPLVIALRQIVPESDQLTYGANVPLGSMVDWNGGKPWKDVLMSTLIPLGLTASENGSLVKIERL